MENESKKNSSKPDVRPELSRKLSLLEEAEQWFTWDGARIKLGPPKKCFYPGSVSIIVDRGRFGMAYIIDKDGLRATDIVWLGGKRSATNLYIRPSQIRASVLEAHSGGNLGWLMHQIGK